MDCRKTHLINENGDRKVVETRRAEEEIKRLSKSTNTTYHIDIDWYLANGYMSLEDMRKSIEGPNYEQERQNEGI